MTTIKLNDTQWEKIRDFIQKEPNAYVGTDKHECRQFMEAVLWMSRSGASWRLLPAEYGKWNSIYKRFVRWCKNGVWERMFLHFADDPDMENGMIDSTIVRSHPCAAGAPKKTVSRH